MREQTSTGTQKHTNAYMKTKERSEWCFYCWEEEGVFLSAPEGRSMLEDVQ